MNITSQMYMYEQQAEAYTVFILSRKDGEWYTEIQRRLIAHGIRRSSMQRGEGGEREEHQGLVWSISAGVSFKASSSCPLSQLLPWVDSRNKNSEVISV